MFHSSLSFRIRGYNKYRALQAIKTAGAVVRRTFDESIVRGAASSVAKYCIERNDSVWQMLEETNGSGDIVKMSCLTQGEDSIFWMIEAVAPFVERGSSVVWCNQDEDFRRWFFSGTSAVESRQQCAFDLWSTRAENDSSPKHVAAQLYRVAELYFKMGEYQESIRLLDETLDIAPNHIDAYFLRGSALVKSGRMRRGLRDCIHALRLEQQHEVKHSQNQVISVL